MSIIINLFNPKNENVYEVDSPNGTQGEEPIYFISQVEGIYRLEVRSLDKNAEVGKYEIKIKDLRASIAEDVDRVDGYKAFTEAEFLRVEGKPENVDTAIEKYLSAIEKFDKAKELLSKAFSISALGVIYYNKGDYSKAEPLYIQAIEITRKALGENHPNTANSINNLASLYDKKGEYDKAEPLYIQALEINRKANHPNTAGSINNLAVLYKAKGEYEKAEPLLIQAVEIKKKTLGENNPFTATSINNLASLYQDKGDYSKAEPLFIQALEIYRKALGENHPNTAILISNLAELYRDKGEYTKAEPLYIQAIEITCKALGENHPNIALSINNLASLYNDKGDYSKAELLLIQALEIYRKALGNNHPSIAIQLNNLAVLYKAKGDYSKIEPLLIQALEIRKKTLGENHPFTATSMFSLAYFYRDKGEYAKAEPLLIQAVDINRKALGDNHPLTARSINNLATLYRDKEEYSKAELLNIQAVEIARKALGENHPFTAQSINSLAELYYSKGENEKAVKYQKEANEVREGELARNLLIGSEKSKQAYLQQYANETDFTLSLHTQLVPKDEIAYQMALIQVLRRKGRSIDAINQSIEALRNRSKKEDIALLDELTDKKRLFSNLTTQGLGKITPNEYKAKLKALQQEIDTLEYKISERSLEFRSQSKPITLENVQNAIPTNSTLVEFASYRTYGARTKKYGARRYVVYLLDREGKSKWADLGEAEPIDKLVDELRTKLKSKKTSVNREIKPLARRLDKLVMQPVRKLTKKGNRLLIAPDGKLNLIPFAALVDERGKYLVESYPISYLTSGRDLLRLQVKIESKSEPVIIGNPDFGQLEASNEKDSKIAGSVFSELYFAPLKATETEAKAIKQLLPSANLLMQKEANEQALNSLNAPSILHIATHGFFLTEEDLSNSSSNSEDEQSRIAKKEKTSTTSEKTNQAIKLENPLLRSGIALAGANLNQNQENSGIFTALKTTGLNLWGTKVVVLSACDTGVGEVKNGDGIYGLRRALVLAGSESQVMSLWPVSDNGTKDLMIAYYTKLEKGIGRSDALRQVQLELLKNPKRRHPFYWASFIQSGEWANLDGNR